MPDKDTMQQNIPENPAVLAQTEWDLIVIGGGITGAAVLREAARYGLKCLLLEQRDFAWGASSRSGKWVHGGLRYIKEGQLNVTWHSVKEREKLCRELPGLIRMKAMHWPLFRTQVKNGLMIRAGLFLYDLMAGKRWRHALDKTQMQQEFPGLNAPDLTGAMCFYEGQTDDARLTLRVLQEARHAGAVACNYTEVSGFLKQDGKVCGVIARATGITDQPQPEVRIKARQVIAATGAWADQLRQHISHDTKQKLRPLRGSHLVFSFDRLPIRSTIILQHPRDKRPGFITCFQGRIIVGNTDIDHQQHMSVEASVSADEVNYLLQTVQHYFPSYGIGREDIIATFSGVRPVVDSGVRDPSKESRDHVVWHEDGLLTIAGGKLTTFQHIATDALRRIKDKFPQLQELSDHQPIISQEFNGTRQVKAILNEELREELSKKLCEELSEEQLERLHSRYGSAVSQMINGQPPQALEIIPGTQTHWFELSWCARHEQIKHLDDLLLRRTRIGLLLENGGERIFDGLRHYIQPACGWSDDKWQQEISRYRQLWQTHYSVPPAQTPTPTPDQSTAVQGMTNHA